MVLVGLSEVDWGGRGLRPVLSQLLSARVSGYLCALLVIGFKCGMCCPDQVGEGNWEGEKRIQFPHGAHHGLGEGR